MERLSDSPILSSIQRTGLASNLEAQKLRLSDADLRELAALERGGREINPVSLATVWN